MCKQCFQDLSVLTLEHTHQLVVLFQLNTVHLPMGTPCNTECINSAEELGLDCHCLWKSRLNGSVLGASCFIIATLAPWWCSNLLLPGKRGSRIELFESRYEKSKPKHLKCECPVFMPKTSCGTLTPFLLQTRSYVVLHGSH